MRVIITAGGTGGHIYPALSILNKIKEQEPNSEILYIGTHNRMEKDLIPSLGIKYQELKITGFNRKKLLKNFKTIDLFLKSISIARKIIHNFKPDIVIGCGGYVTAPVIYAASKLKIKTFIHEQNSVIGMSNKFLSKYASLIGVSFESTLNLFPKNKVIYTGNPCSESAINAKKADKTKYHLNKNKKLVLIVMGSLGSSSVNDKIVKMLDKLSTKEYELVFVTGKNYYEKVKNKKYNNIQIVPFVDPLTSLMKVVDVIVTRAGASTISEIIALNIPSIFVPSPYVPNNHQYKNAMDLVQKEAGLIVEEKDIEQNLISSVDELINNSSEMNKIKENLKKMMVNNSASIIYNEIRKLVDNNGKIN